MNRKPFSATQASWLGAVGTAFLLVWSAVLGSANLTLAQENLDPHLPREDLLERADRQESGAMEVRLRAQVEVAEPIVRLADVGECLPAEAPLAQRVAQAELFPSPAPGGRRYVSSLEIEEILLRRGLPVGQIRLTGANQVEIRRQRSPSGSASVDTGCPTGTGPVQSRSSGQHRRRAEAIVHDAILTYLQQKAPQQSGWEVKLSVKQELTEILSDKTHLVEVRGGTPPWTGTQWFELILNTPQGLRSLVVQGEVSTGAAVVVAAHPIPKGAVLQPEDLALQPIPANEKTDGYFCQIEQLVGKEALRGLPAGRPIPQDAVQAPLLVRRGQIITISARAPGIRVRTQARAKDDGSLGDLVAVESLSDRKVYFARVCGLQEAEVFARGVHTEGQFLWPSQPASATGPVPPAQNPISPFTRH